MTVQRRQERFKYEDPNLCVVKNHSQVDYQISHNSKIARKRSPNKFLNFFKLTESSAKVLQFFMIVY